MASVLRHHHAEYEKSIELRLGTQVPAPARGAGMAKGGPWVGRSLLNLAAEYAGRKAILLDAVSKVVRFQGSREQPVRQRPATNDGKHEIEILKYLLTGVRSEWFFSPPGGFFYP
jgi:hypothetical protein